MSLNFSVLNSSAASHLVIDSYCPKCSSAGFDLFGLLAEPEMDVPLKSARFQLFR